MEFDWSNGDVVFANSTCFEDELMDNLGKHAERLKPGAFLVTFTKGIESPNFEELYKRRYDVLWMILTAYLIDCN